MGSFHSRPADELEDIDLGAQNAYRYPPKSGNYFGSHFIMGGDKFDTPQPEAFLFGDCMDLNFLGSKPTPFPYPAPHPNEPTKTLKALVNVRKESVHFVKLDCKEEEPRPSSPAHVTVENGAGNPADGCRVDTTTVPPSKPRFNIEFVLDCDCRCAVTMHYLCTEEVTPQGLMYTSRDPSRSSATLKFQKGANQTFSLPTHIFDPSNWTEEDMAYSYEDEIMPVVIHCVAEEGEEPRQSQATIAVIEKFSDGTFGLKAFKQKLFVDGLCYLLQEIYGIENKQNVPFDGLGGGGGSGKPAAVVDACGSDDEDTGAECVICMSDPRDTLILPCRHLCLCNRCAESLRYQANNCPICRVPFRALLQIRAVQKRLTADAPESREQASTQDGGNLPNYLTRGMALACWGYESVSLLEALNGWRRTTNADAANQTLTDNGPNGSGDAKDTVGDSAGDGTAASGRENAAQPSSRRTGDRSRTKEGGARKSRKSSSSTVGSGSTANGADGRQKSRGPGKSHSKGNATASAEGAEGGGAREDDDEVDESKWMLSFSEIRAIVEDMRREEESGVRKKLVESLKETSKREAKPPLAVAETVTDDDEIEMKGVIPRSSSSSEPIQYIDGGSSSAEPESENEMHGAVSAGAAAALDEELLTPQHCLNENRPSSAAAIDEEDNDGATPDGDARSSSSSVTMSPPNSAQSTGSCKSSSHSADSSKSLVSKRKKPALVPHPSSNGTQASVEVLGDGRYNIRSTGGGNSVQGNNV